MSCRVPPKTKAARKRICIIAEGYEEELYLERLRELCVWDPMYEVEIMNAKSITNVASMYQNYYSNGRYHLVLVFCDTDRSPYTQYQTMKRAISLVHDGNLETAKQVIVHANPCSMQIVLSHFSDAVSLRTQNKAANAPMIAELTGVKGYRGHQEQIKEICRRIKRSNYVEMRRRIGCISQDDDVTPSTDFGVLLERLHSDDPSWITTINDALEVD